MKKFLAVAVSGIMLAAAFGGCKKKVDKDFSQYVGTNAYRVVTTADELIEAIVDAKCHYTNVWDEATSTYTQVPAEGYTEENFLGSVRVIEIANDLNLGYYKLSEEAKRNTSIVSDYAANASKWTDYLYMSDMLKENGISQIKVENTSELLIFSKNGAKLTHCGFKLTSDHNVVFRNLQFDEMWQWEDAPTNVTDKIGDYDWFGWAYFKISFSGFVWIDHCTFGKSYDGQIDYSNPVYDANKNLAVDRAPYGADGSNDLRISNCKFLGGSDDKDGYVYKMMKSIEDDYQAGGTGHLYYNALRDGGISFEDILYALAIPQKKGFLFGDSGNGTTDYDYNLKLSAAFSSCIFKNIEDRLPKLRGGNIFMYNSVADSSQYYEYRTKLRAANAASKVSAVKGSWKCALVSQGIVCGNGGSVKAENCIFKGIDTLLKNNDSGGKTENGVTRTRNGGYELENCRYYRRYVVDCDTVLIEVATLNPGTTLSRANFKWNTSDGKQPYEIDAINLDVLENELFDSNSGSGARSNLDDRWYLNKFIN